MPQVFIGLGHFQKALCHVCCLRNNKSSKKLLIKEIADNPTIRIQQHNKGYNRTTIPYRPIKTILLEKYSTLQEAREREVFLKLCIGRVYIKYLKNQRCTCLLQVV